MAKKREMTEDHKDAIRVARDQNRRVRAYLDLQAGQARRKPRVTALAIEKAEKRLPQIAQELAATNDVIARLKLAQEELDLQAFLVEANSMSTNAEEAERITEEFVEVAAAFSQRCCISYRAWRHMGVPSAVLHRAGISRTS